MLQDLSSLLAYVERSADDLTDCVSLRCISYRWKTTHHEVSWARQQLREESTSSSRSESFTAGSTRDRWKKWVDREISTRAFVPHSRRSIDRIRFDRTSRKCSMEFIVVWSYAKRINRRKRFLWRRRRENDKEARGEEWRKIDKAKRWTRDRKKG